MRGEKGRKRGEELSLDVSSQRRSWFHSFELYNFANSLNLSCSLIDMPS